MIILWKFQKILTSETCWKPASNLPTTHISELFAAILTMGKNKNIMISLKIN